MERTAIPSTITDIDNWAFGECEKLTSIKSGGTIAQRTEIEKGSHRDYKTGNYTVQCTDGEITKSDVSK